MRWRLTTGCSGRSAARPAAEPERWAVTVEPHRRAGVEQSGLFVGREGVAVSLRAGQRRVERVTA
jgi:hypothetical protein